MHGYDKEMRQAVMDMIADIEAETGTTMGSIPKLGMYYEEWQDDELSDDVFLALMQLYVQGTAD